MAKLFGGSIRFRTADFRVGEYPTSLSYPAHLKIRGKVERRTTTLTQGGSPEVIIADMLARDAETADILENIRGML